MPMPQNPWRARYRQASFRSANFFTEVAGRASGRRVAIHEYPKKNTPFAEDMGQRAVHFTVTGFVIANANNNFNYIPDMQALINACEQGGPGSLILPTIPGMQVECTNYSVQEMRERGGYAAFEMQFVEAGDASNVMVPDQTPQTAAQAASNFDFQSQQTFDNMKWVNGGFSNPQSPGTSAGGGGVGGIAQVGLPASSTGFT
jgi:prophage DNA circulation protein